MDPSRDNDHSKRERAPWLKELGAKRLERGVGRIQNIELSMDSSVVHAKTVPHPGQDGHDYMGDGSIN